MIDKAKLIAYAADYGVTVDDTAAERLDVYARMLADWNTRMNLTAITDADGILLKHFVDSLTALPLLPAGACSLIDVGTGAGFPGVPLALVRGDMRLTLLDSLNKRLVFLKELCAAVELPVTLIHARAEEGGRQAALREQFDVATARAVAALPTLCEYCLPFVRVGGRFIAMKGPDSDGEVEAARHAADLLGGSIREVCDLQLPKSPTEGQYGRRLIVVEKTAATSANYPRPSAKIAKQPL